MNPKIHGHRGARGRRPENTLPAIEYALQQGVDGVEVDLCVTADDAIVLHHDLRLNPDTTRDARGNWIEAEARIPVRGLRLDELREYDVGRLKPGAAYTKKFAQPGQTPVDGVHPPTLAECAEFICRRASKDTLLNLELKTSPAEPALAPEPDAYAALVLDEIHRLCLAESVFLQSFDWGLMASVKKHLKRRGWTLKTGFTKQRPYGLADARQVKTAGGDVFSCHYGGLREPLVRAVHALGLEVCAWTVNEPRDIAKVAGWGVDVITTDYPERCRGLDFQPDPPIPQPANTASAVSTGGAPTRAGG